MTTATALQEPNLILRGKGVVFNPELVNVLDDKDFQFLLNFPQFVNDALDAAKLGRLRAFLTYTRSTIPPELLRHTLGYITALRNGQLDVITSQIGASGLLRIYDGTRPATGGAATTLLAELALSATVAPAASGGVLTFNAISNDASADNTGTATWHRFATSGGTAIIDGSVSTAAADLNFNTTSFVAGAVIAVTSYTITAGNA